ncbi:hypothetical protein F2P79_006254 [Pimephales promelas]|nr:hypothetical protein F2P79_006254 [Pimephales promelas]
MRRRRKSNIYLVTDASDLGLGAVLMQEEPGGMHPVVYLSRKLFPRETRYSVVEKECLAEASAGGRKYSSRFSFSLTVRECIVGYMFLTLGFAGIHDCSMERFGIKRVRLFPGVLYIAHGGSWEM